MKRNPFKKTAKQLKDMGGKCRRMTFVKRERATKEYDANTICVTIRDHFRHDETGVIVVRELDKTTYHDGKTSQYVRWYCPELGGGNAGLSYWLMLARKR